MINGISVNTKKILLAILIVLIAFRIGLPYMLLQYAVYRINKIPEYRVTIADVDVHLYRGSYTIKNIRLSKVTNKIPVPFFSAKRVDLAIEWRALFHGSFVGQMNIDYPMLNFVIDPAGKNEQLSIDREWQNAVKALFPLNFNKITVENGAVHFRSFSSNPPFDLYLKNLDAQVDNLRTVADHLAKKLPSTLALRANTMDGANVQLNIDFDPSEKQPTFNLKGMLENMRISAANNFLHHYTKIDVKSGLFSLYVEAAAAHGKIKGYAKPIIKNLKVIEPDKNMTPIEALYKGALQLVAKILENPNKKTVATRITIKGNIQNPDTSIWSIVGNLLSHAFVQALLPQIDNTVDIQDVELK